MSLHELADGKPDLDKQRKLFRRFEFKGWLKEVENAAAAPAARTRARGRRRAVEEAQLRRTILSRGRS